jgi:hypothetical protein
MSDEDPAERVRRAAATMVILAFLAGCQGSGCARGQSTPGDGAPPGDVSVLDSPTRVDASVDIRPPSSAFPSNVDAGCPDYPYGHRGRTPGFSKVDYYPQQFANFLFALKRGSATDDREAVASVIDSDSVGLTRDQFIGRYDEIMTPCLKQSIACVTVESVAENYLGAWLAHDAILVDMRDGRFFIIGFTGEGPCYSKERP